MSLRERVGTSEVPSIASSYLSGSSTTLTNNANKDNRDGTFRRFMEAYSPGTEYRSRPLADDAPERVEILLDHRGDNDDNDSELSDADYDEPPWPRGGRRRLRRRPRTGDDDDDDDEKSSTSSWRWYFVTAFLLAVLAWSVLQLYVMNQTYYYDDYVYVGDDDGNVPSPTTSPTTLTVDVALLELQQRDDLDNANDHDHDNDHMSPPQPRPRRRCGPRSSLLSPRSLCERSSFACPLGRDDECPTGYQCYSCDDNAIARRPTNYVKVKI